MTTLDRAWANNQLRHCRNSSILTLAGMHLIKNGAVQSVRGDTIVIKPTDLIFSADVADRQGERFEVELAQLADEHANHNSRLTESLVEWWKFVRRNLCKESFEITKSYANENGSFSALQKQPWYPYARTIRNAISHDLHFKFTASDLAKLPVTWKGHLIDAGVQGKDMMNNLLDPHTVWALHDEMVTFVNSH